jgi:heme oxygenase
MDHHPLLAPLVRPALSLDHYRYVLRVMNWFHVPLHERLIAAMEEFIPDAHYMPSDRPKWLAEDLKWFGMDAMAAPEIISACPQPRFTSAESLVGALYVLEGSTLGGQVIARQLAESIGVYAGKGASFFQGHAAGTESHWNDFWCLADQVCATGSIAQACTAAVGMFDDMKHFLDSCIQQLPKLTLEVA